MVLCFIWLFNNVFLQLPGGGWVRSCYSETSFSGSILIKSWKQGAWLLCSLLHESQLSSIIDLMCIKGTWSITRNTCFAEPLETRINRWNMLKRRYTGNCSVCQLSLIYLLYICYAFVFYFRFYLSPTFSKQVRASLFQAPRWWWKVVQ